MTIYRADPPEVETLEIELSKKPNKNLGLGFFTANPRGLLVTDIVRELMLSNLNPSFLMKFTFYF